MTVWYIAVTLGAFMAGYFMGTQQVPEPIPIPATVVKECKRSGVSESVYSKVIEECATVAIRCAITIDAKDKEIESCWELNKHLSSENCETGYY